MDTDLAKTIGGAARAARHRLELTQAEVAERVGIATEFYSRIERGGTLPSVPTLVKLAEVLAVPTDVLLGRSPLDNPTSAPLDPLDRAARTGSRAKRLVAQRLSHASPEALRVVRLVLTAFEKAEAARPRRKGSSKR